MDIGEWKSEIQKNCERLFMTPNQNFLLLVITITNCAQQNVTVCLDDDSDEILTNLYNLRADLIRKKIDT